MPSVVAFVAGATPSVADFSIGPSLLYARQAHLPLDGYAVLAGPAGRTLRVTGESRAGTPSDRHLNDGEAIRISTGAAVPTGATAVIRQEDAERQGDDVHLGAAVAAGENIRGAGEDMPAGATVLSAGTRLRIPPVQERRKK